MRRVRYILDLKDNQITKIFKHVNVQTTEQQVNHWLKREDEDAFVALKDEELIDFLDAIIIEKRGKKEGAGERIRQPLDNNLILMKLKIAFHLKAEEALAIMELAQFRISKHEFSALFRKKDHKHYRACKNQMLRKFMKGLQIKYRGRPNQGVSSKNKPVLPTQNNQKEKKTLRVKRKPETSKFNKGPKVKSFKRPGADKAKYKDPKPKSKTESKSRKPSSKPSKAASIWKIPKK